MGQLGIRLSLSQPYPSPCRTQPEPKEAQTLLRGCDLAQWGVHVTWPRRGAKAKAEGLDLASYHQVLMCVCIGQGQGWGGREEGCGNEGAQEEEKQGLLGCGKTTALSVRRAPF